MLAAGSHIGRYEVAARIGAGGMGEVYRALDPALQRSVALKILAGEATADHERVRRFQREARAASALNHPGIIHVYEIGEATLDKGIVHYIAMELVDGLTLREKLNCRIDQRELLGWLASVADALEKAHSTGIVHRDLKPENIMITRDGYAKVLDFGLAKLQRDPSEVTDHDSPTDVVTRANQLVGTPSYMSPEQVEGRELDHRSDIFSLGCIFYEVVAGRSAFAGSSVIDVLHNIVHRVPEPLGDHRLQKIASRCLSKEAHSRYSSAADLAADIRDYLAVANVEGSTRRRPVRLFIAAGVIAVAGSVWIASQLTQWSGRQAASSADVLAPVKPVTASVFRGSEIPEQERAANLELLEHPEFLDGQKVYRGKAVDLDLRSADISDVLMMFATIIGVDISADPDVSGVATIHSEGRPWDELFDHLLQQNNLTYRVEHGLVIISTDRSRPN